jgi:branched-chain amino acid aminotransferase
MSLPKLEIHHATSSKLNDFDFNNIPFGKNFTDHMLIAEYNKGEWVSWKIVPYGNLSLPPSTTSFHYAQAIFEGMKAFRSVNGDIVLFRPLENQMRLNRSAARIAMPDVPEAIFMEGLSELIRLDKGWVPEGEETSLYIRPFMIGSEPFIGVKKPEQFLFMIILSPVGPYYAEDVSVYVDEINARAVKGVGEAKFAGNYAATLQPVEDARTKGYKDILWLDSEQHQWIQEVGTMNIFFVIDGEIHTPVLDGGFLPGITRDSIIQLARHKGYTVHERPIAIHEIAEAIENGSLTEVFGTGTAAVVTFINRIGFRGTDYTLSSANYRIAPALKRGLTEIQKGIAEDTFGWVFKVC